MMQRRIKARGFRRAAIAVAAGAALAIGGITPGFAADVPTYVNAFGSNTTAQFTQMMPDDLGIVAWDGANQRASVSGSNVGQTYRTDSQSPVTLDGTVSVKLTLSSQYRAGVMFRGVDADNYSFVGVDTASTIRIREKIAGASTDIVVGAVAQGATIPASISVASGEHILAVTYRADNIRVLIDGTVLYDGARPRVGTPAVAGRAGIVAWSATNTQFDDLSSTPRDTYNYSNPFTTGLGAFTKISSTGATSMLSASNGVARLVSNTASGDLLFRDDSVETRTNGYASAKFNVANAQNFRIGLGFRMGDSANYSWVAMETSSSVRVREVIGGVAKDITIAPSGADVAANIGLAAGIHDLAVSYFGDDLEVRLDGTLIYQGKRPHVRAATGQAPTLGRVGIVGWSITDSTIDDLTYSAEAPAAAIQKDSIASSALAVEVDKGFPQVLTYALSASGQKLDGGTADARIVINDASYLSSSVYTKTATNAARWVVTVPGVDLDAGGPLAARTVTLTYDLSVIGNVATTRLSTVSGDASGYRFAVRLSSPALKVSSSQNAATVSGATGGDEFFLPLTGTSTLSKPSVANAFVSTAGAVGSIYMPNSYSSPYSVQVAGTAGVSTATVGSPTFDWRFFDGVRSTRETTLGTLTEQTPESRVFIGADGNGDSTVDWQDGALWLRTQVPQMPGAVRDFFDGGNWSQVHGAFPGPGTAAANNQGFTVPYTSLEQLTQIQREVQGLTDGVGRQSFEYVGWNGRGHDYGWPSINELVFNPAIGTDSQMISAKSDIDALGGDLSFHVNMTDMTDVSPAYLRNTSASPFGNRSSSTGTTQYGAGIFGWNAYQIDMFKDMQTGAPTARQNAFVDRFFAPRFIYQDVMLPYPSGGRTTLDENYAMSQQIDHWKALGTTAATEYFQIQKYTAGGFLFKNNQSPGVIEGFLTAGNVAISNTRNYASQPRDYIWGTLYSDNTNPSNVNATSAGAGGGNRAAERLQQMTFLYSYLNGFLADKGLVGYKDDTTNNRYVTTWGGNTTFAVDKSTGVFSVVSGGVTIADGSDRFIPAYDGTNRVLMYSLNGSTKQWKLPASLSGAATVDLFKLTTEGRSFVQTLSVANGGVNVAMSADSAYVVAPAGGAHPLPARDLALGAVIDASSNAGTDYNSSTNLWTGREFATVPASSSPSGDWRNEIKALTAAMVDGSGNLRYERPIVAANVADGASGTYWSPNHESARGAVDLADGNAWVQMTFPAATSVSKVRIDEKSTAGNAVTGFKVQVLAGSTWTDVSTGTVVPSGDITFSPVTTTAVRLLITSAAGSAPRIASVAAFG